METELLSLKWNNHKNTFLGVVKSLRSKASYSDATLACEGKFYNVHKIVLSVCSDYFAEIFDSTPCKNPVVVLKDISYKSMQFLLDYMYLGEVNVKQSELAVLIKAAECLRIKGLAAPDDEPEPSSPGESKKNKLTDSDEPPPKRRKKRHIQSMASTTPSSHPDSPITIEDPISESVKSEPIDPPEEYKDVEDKSNELANKIDDICIEKEEIESYQFDPGSSGTMQEPEETWQDYTFDESDPDYISSTADGPTAEGDNKLNRKNQCKICGKWLSLSSKLSEHYMIHEGQRPYKCTDCSYSSTRIANVRRHHMTRHSKFRLFSCNNCSFTSMYEDKFVGHLSEKHCNDEDLCLIRKKLKCGIIK